MAADFVLDTGLRRGDIWDTDIVIASFNSTGWMKATMIRYLDTPKGIHPDQLAGFFVGWPNPPSPECHLDILKRSTHVVLAVDEESNRVVGFINAISDGILSANLPLLEVLPEYQHSGIGSELVARMLSKLKRLYMIDLVCDDRLRPYYEKLGMRAAVGMMIRNYDRQSGA